MSSWFRINAALRILSERRKPAMPRKAKPGKKYKLKTHKATSKRFRLTGSGVLVRTKGGKSHLRRRTSDRTKALLSKTIPVKGRSIIKRIKRLNPNMES